MKTYDEKFHAKKRLLKMLEREDICACCPAVSGFRARFTFRLLKNTRREELGIATAYDRVCAICKGFVGLDSNKKCPCQELGKEEAIKRTWIALEAKGYI